MLLVFSGRNTHHTSVLAQVDLAFPAKAAGTAVDRRIERNTISGAPAGYAWSCANDLAGCFVPHDQRRISPAGRTVPPVNIAAANSAGADPNHHFVLGRLRLGEINEFEF